MWTLSRALVGLDPNDPGAGWTLGPGEKAQAAAQGYSKYDVMTLAIKTSGLLQQVIDLSEQTAGESQEVEVLKAKIAALNGQAQVLASANVGNYKSLFGQYQALAASYTDILSRAEAVEDEPVPHAPAGPAKMPVQPGVTKFDAPPKVEIKPAGMSKTLGYGLAAALAVAGVVLLKVGKAF